MPTERAWHESGHAVCAVILGVPVKSVTLDLCTTLKRKGCETASWHQALIALSGMAAEREALGYTADQCDEQLKTNWAIDVENAKRNLGSNDLGLVMRQARWLMHDNRDAIEKVATALDEKGELAGDDVVALLSE